MIQLLLKTHLAFLLIPLLTLAIEPTNPTGLCDRFLGADDKAACLQKTNKDSLDWYASAACGLQQEDKNFLSCLDEIKGASFHPEALELCAKSPEISDEARMSCLQTIKNKDYSRSQLKKCSEAGESVAVQNCLKTQGRAPASKNAPSGFQEM